MLGETAHEMHTNARNAKQGGRLFLPGVPISSKSSVAHGDAQKRSITSNDGGLRGVRPLRVEHPVFASASKTAHETAHEIRNDCTRKDGMKITGKLSLEAPDKATALLFVAAFAGYTREHDWNMDDVEIEIWAPDAEIANDDE